MAQSSVPIYDLTELARYIAEEAFESTNPWNWYRDFGAVEGFSNGEFTIRPGTMLATSHLLFIEWMGVRIGVDEYGEVHLFLNSNPIQHHLQCIVADAMATMRSDKERHHVEVEHLSDNAEMFSNISMEREGRIFR